MRHCSFVKNDSSDLRILTVSFTYSGLHYIYQKAEQCPLDCFCQLRSSLAGVPVIDEQKNQIDEKFEWNGVVSRLSKCWHGNMVCY